MLYPFKTNWLMRSFYPSLTWEMPAEEKKIYLTFDDGPHPEITPWVLETLKTYNARATFFCIGKNVEAYPDTYAQILRDGHAVGNHSYSHLNGWKTDSATYFEDIGKAKTFIDSKLFRPPYGRISKFQAKYLQDRAEFRIIMWTVLSGDFDMGLSNEQCLKAVQRYARSGSIVVFHDSEKAVQRMKFALPLFLAGAVKEGYVFDGIKTG